MITNSFRSAYVAEFGRHRNHVQTQPNEANKILIIAPPEKKRLKKFLQTSIPESNLDTFLQIIVLRKYEYSHRDTPQYNITYK